MLISWILIIISALLYALPCTFINWCWWMSCFFLIPLFYLAYRNQLRFLYGLVWGLLATTLHNIGEFYSALVQIEASSFFGILVVLCTNLYFALHAACIFALASWGSKLLVTKNSAHNRWVELIIWSCAFTLFFIFMSSYCFWIFIRPEGNPTTHPLVPLALHPALLYLVSLLGKQIFLLLLVIWQGVLTLLIVQPCIGLAMIWSIMTCTWFMSTFSQQQEITPAWLSRIGYLPRSIEQKFSVSYCARTLRCYMASVLNADSEVDIIIVPEDGFQSSNLDLPQVCSQFALESINSKPIQLLVGAYRKENAHSYNTLYWLSNGQLMHHFDKRHTMILTEKTPPLFGFNFFKKLDEGKISLSAGINERPVFNLDSNIRLTPYICSELYLNDKPDDNFSNQTVIALCSEKWIQFSFIKDRLFLLARLQAITWQRDILYITYHFGAFITKNGNVFMLKDFSKELAQCDEQIQTDQKQREIYEKINTKKYDLLSIDDVPRFPKITTEQHIALLLPLSTSHTGITFIPTTPWTNMYDEIKTIITYEKKDMHEQLVHAYLIINDIRAFYIDSMTLSASTNHLIVNMLPRGTVVLKDPLSAQTIILSRYR